MYIRELTSSISRRPISLGAVLPLIRLSEDLLASPAAEGAMGELWT